jgi:hypothetical protein
METLINISISNGIIVILVSFIIWLIIGQRNSKIG